MSTDNIFLNKAMFPAFASKFDSAPKTDWKYLKSDFSEIHRDYFNGIAAKRYGFVTLVQEDGCNCDFTQSFTVFNESGRHAGFQPDEDTYLFTVRIMVKKNPDLLRQAKDKCKPAENEVFFFVEDNELDMSSAKLYALFGKEAQKNILLNLDSKGKIKSFLKNLPDIDEAVISDLIKNGYAEGKISFVKEAVLSIYAVLKYIGFLPMAAGKVLSGIGDFILDFFSLPESAWNSHSEAYFLKKENLVNALTISPEGLKDLRKSLVDDPNTLGFTDYVPDIILRMMDSYILMAEAVVIGFNEGIEKKISAIYDDIAMDVFVFDVYHNLSETAAFIAGLWNGLVDFIGTLLTFAGQIMGMSYYVFDNIDAVLEWIDSLRDIITNLSVEDFYDAASDVLKKIVNFFSETDQTDFNWDRIYYSTGFALTFIITLFIPLGSLVDAAAILAKLKKVLAPIDLIEKLGEATAKTAEALKGVTQKAAQTGKEAIEAILRLLARKKAGLVEFFEKIWQKIANWLLANSKLYRAVKNIITKEDLANFISANRLNVTGDLEWLLTLTVNRKDLCESILLGTREVIEGKTIRKLISLLKIPGTPKPASLSFYQARVWYLWQESLIAPKIAKLTSLEKKAKAAFELRNQIRTAAREYMKDRKWAQYLSEVEKNLVWEEYLEKLMTKKSIQSERDAYKYIIESSQRSRRPVNKLFKIKN